MQGYPTLGLIWLPPKIGLATSNNVDRCITPLKIVQLSGYIV